MGDEGGPGSRDCSWDHVESAATLCCLTHSQQCSLQDVISPLAIINLSSPGSERLQGRFAIHQSWWCSLPGSCCTLHSHPSYAQGSCHHPSPSQLAAEDPDAGGEGDVTKAQQAHFTWISFTQQHTWAYKISSADHSSEIMLATLIQIDCLSPTQIAPFEGNANVCTFERNVKLP